MGIVSPIHPQHQAAVRVPVQLRKSALGKAHAVDGDRPIDWNEFHKRYFTFVNTNCIE